MGVFEAVVVFFSAWWLIFLPILSAGTRSQHEAGAVIPGTEVGIARNGPPNSVFGFGSQLSS